MGKIGKIGMENIPSKLLETFDGEEEEFIVVIGEDSTGAGKAQKDSYWTASLDYIACVRVRDGMTDDRKGRLLWVLTKSEQQSWEYFGYFDKNTIYRVRGRRPGPSDDPKTDTDAYKNRIYVTEILEENAKNKAMEELLTKYKKEVSIESDLLGKLVLNKEFNWYEGTGDWCGERIPFQLEIEEEDQVEEGLKLLEQFFGMAKEWDERMRKAAAEKLTDLANDWKDDDEEMDGTPDITEEDFAERIAICSIYFNAEGYFTADYDDDDMFWGHSVCVDGNIETGIDDASMQG